MNSNFLQAQQFQTNFLNKYHHPSSDTFKILLTDEALERGVQKLADDLNEKFKNHDKEIVIAGILKGVYVLMSDLTKKLTFPHSVYFIDASSYRGQVQEAIDIKKDIGHEITAQKFIGKTVILLDELFDKGATMDSVKNYLVNFLNVQEVYTCVLFLKDLEKREYPLPDFWKIKVPNTWIFGYGLDLNGLCRGWNALYAIPKEDQGKNTKHDRIFEDNEYYMFKFNETNDF